MNAIQPAIHPSIAIAVLLQEARAVLVELADLLVDRDALGLRVADGAQLLTDMPAELGGSGDQVTPGWLFRAGLAACATTSIVLMAAAEGMELAALEVRAGSRSDTRGLLGMNDEAGRPVYAGPLEMHLQVQVEAPGVAPDRLRALVERALACSPVPCMVGQAHAMAVQIDIASA